MFTYPASCLAKLRHCAINAWHTYVVVGKLCLYAIVSLLGNIYSYTYIRVFLSNGASTYISVYRCETRKY